MADDGLLGLVPPQRAEALLGLGASPLDDPVIAALTQLPRKGNAVRAINETAAAAKPMSWGEYVDDIVRQIANGMTFGFADEIAAGANTVLPITSQAHANNLSNQFTGQGKSIYEQNLEAERAKDAGFRRDHPVAATTAELAGGLTTGLPGAARVMAIKALAKVPTIVKAAATGAAEGGVGGFGAGEGGLGPRLENAAVPAAVGAVAGAVLPPIVRAIAGRARLASRSAGLYDPPVKPPRPFEADYPTGAPADATGRLTADIEGKPLGARIVVGRNMVGGDDVTFPQAELNALTEAGTGSRPSVVPARQMGQNAGNTLVDRRSGLPLGVRLRSNLTPQQALRVHAHENAHVIDQLAGEIDTTGLQNELRQVYNTLNTGWERARRLTGPQHQGYSTEQQPRELMAEAIRAYMADPNYLKTVAPKTAARIRGAVNANPRIAPFIQFNELLGLGATAAGAAALLGTSSQE
jgi:hypothetical protein